MLKLYNTLTRKKEIFKPIKRGQVLLYTCGPTVYLYAHIGNFRTFLFEDILRRVLEYNGYKVKQVMNITDVGHLTSDADTGEDKMLKALKREGKKLNEQSILKIADFYTRAFKKDMKRLNIQEPSVWCKATEHIQEQIEMIKKLINNGYAYETDTAVYFDTSKLKDYGRLARLDLSGQKEAVSTEKRVDKKNPFDFSLWLKLVGEHKNHIMNWDSPWGRGFPGWHIECSAMSIKYLGEKFDIHCGGIDHIPVHHTNERAQNIGAVGHPVVNWWMHGEFLVLKDSRIGKSAGNIILVEDLIKRGYNPLAYRYLVLSAHYRSKLTFSWGALDGAQNALDNLYEKIRELKTSLSVFLGSSKSQVKIKKDRCQKYQKRFLEAINDDLNMPKALAVMWNLIKTKDCSSEEKYKLLLDFDKVLGLGLDKIQPIKIPQKVKKLVEEREKYRQANDFKKADEIRKQIEKLGFKIEDRESGPEIKLKA